MQVPALLDFNQSSKAHCVAFIYIRYNFLKILALVTYGTP